ncbi:fimbrial protein [Serratia ficaria]|uniref:fimbrial protein n=1 Tax=Serratia ficaria TaxID=61651 RepID=UPI00077C24F7|nr:fimbrial protein [Serratia ficaria]CAI1122985.1 Type-1A pilin [Serratia ficaria]CAI1542767.1 Type-1A pilin [Serratia ficaria]CAI2492061.1 Type-1A pilin [Serratia ficaria]VVA49802.1 Type-1 fimbrial protein, A chain precursor [Serratia ficaria]
MVQTKKLIAILLPLALGMSQHAFAEDPVAPSPITVSGGTVKFTGSIVNAPCAVDNSADGQSVELGQYRVADFSKTGDVSAARTFNIGLSNCALDTYSRASVTFSGNTAAGQNTALSLEGGSGAASGVGIQLLRDNTPLAVDGSQASTTTSLLEGANSLSFQAQYIALSDAVTAGAANATADFTLTYQ